MNSACISRFTKYLLAILTAGSATHALAIADNSLPLTTASQLSPVTPGGFFYQLFLDGPDEDPVTALVAARDALAATNLAATHVTAIAGDSTAPATAAGSVKFRDNVDIRAGRNQVRLQGQLFSDSQQGARSGELFDTTGRYHLQMFGTQTEPAISLNGLSAAYTPAVQNSGATLRLRAPDDWQLTSAYFNTRPSSETDSMTPQYQQAGVWNVAASRSWFSNLLTTHLEYARSRYQLENQLADSSEEQADSAVDTRLDIASNGVLDLPLIGSWRAGVLHQSVGNEFHSLGDRYLPAGLTQTQMFFKTSIRNVNVELDWNSEDQARLQQLALAARKSESAAMRFTYTPDMGNTFLFGQLLGAPSLSTSYRRTSEQQPDYPIDDGQHTLLSNIDKVGVDLKFSRESWYWGLRYSASNQDNQFAALPPDPGDTTPAISDWNNDSTVLELGLDPGRRLSLNMNLQWHQQSEGGSASTYYQRQYEIAARWELIPRVCNLSMSYNYGRNFNQLNGADGVATNIATQYGQAQLSWRALTGASNLPAMDVYLQSNYGKYNDRELLAIDEKWSASLGVKLYWAQHHQL